MGKGRVKRVVDGKEVNIGVVVVIGMEGGRRVGEVGVGCGSLRW